MTKTFGINFWLKLLIAIPCQLVLNSRTVEPSSAILNSNCGILIRVEGSIRKLLSKLDCFSCLKFVSIAELSNEKGRDLTKSYDKSPYTNRNVKRAKWQHKQRNKKVEYRAVADRLRTVSWSNYGHPTGVVNLVYGPNLNTPRNSRVIKRTHV